MICGDHGNLEEMVDVTGGSYTPHTPNPVPFILIGVGDVKLRHGRLADIAPTMLELLGIEKPLEMTGKSLINR